MHRRDNSIEGEHIIDLISPYLDNALEAGERERVRAHIATCDICGRELRELQATQQMLRAMPVQVAPRVFTLTEEMAGPKARAETAPSLLSRLLGRALAPRLATGSVLAFTLLLVILVSDLGVLGGHDAGIPLAPSAKLAAGSNTPEIFEQRSMAAPTSTTAAGAVNAMIAPSVAPATGAGGAGEPAGGSDQAYAVPPQATVVAEAAEATATTGSSAAEATATTGTEAPVEGVIADAPTAQDAAGNQPVEPQADGTAVALYNRQAPPDAFGDDNNPAPVAQSPNPGGTAMPVTLLIELGLALLGVGLAIGAIVAMRRNA